jgi:hypothetical protein
MAMRQQPRFPVTFSGTLAYQDDLHLITKSLDLSRKGCRLESPFQATKGMKVNLLLCLPEGETPILIEHAVVRWCGTREIGIEFQSVSPLYRERLDRTLQRLGTTVS